MTKGDIRRLARRGGVKRISSTVYTDVRLALRKHLEIVSLSIPPPVYAACSKASLHTHASPSSSANAGMLQILGDIVAIVHTCDRKTVAVSDVVYALRRRGRSIYGFGDAERSSLRQNV